MSEVLQTVWMIEDILLSLCTVVLMPGIMWHIWRSLNVPVIRTLTILGISWAIFCILLGLSHLNWNFMPTVIPDSVFVLHTASAVGSVIVTVLLFVSRNAIIDGINRQFAVEPIFTDAVMSRLLELNQMLGGQDA